MDYIAYEKHNAVFDYDLGADEITKHLERNACLFQVDTNTFSADIKGKLSEITWLTFNDFADNEVCTCVEEAASCVNPDEAIAIPFLSRIVVGDGNMDTFKLLEKQLLFAHEQALEKQGTMDYPQYVRAWLNSRNAYLDYRNKFTAIKKFWYIEYYYYLDEDDISEYEKNLKDDYADFEFETQRYD